MVVPVPRGSSMVQAITWFIGWTGLSFLAHYFARKVIRSADDLKGTDDKPANIDIMWFFVLALSFVQIAIGGVVLFATKKAYQYVERPRPKHGSRPPSPESNKLLLPTGTFEDTEAVLVLSPTAQVMLALSHFVATTATNASIAFASAAPAFIIKAFEPITTALLAAVVGGKRVETHVIISLPLVAIGAIGFTWRSDFQLTNFFGMSMALLSNILFGLRNIGIKSILHENSKTPSLVTQFHVLSQMSAISASILAWIMVLKSFSTPGLLQYFLKTEVLIRSFSSGIFHVSYTMVSIVVMLTVLSVVAHATANLGKRIIVSMLFYIIGWQPPSTSNVMFGLVFAVGMLVYSNARKFRFSDSQESQSLILSIIFTSFILISAFFPASFIATTHQQTLAGLNPVSEAVNLANPQTLRARKDYFVKKENKIDFVKVDASNIDTLYPNYKTALSEEEEDFLNLDLFKNPDRADWLSKRLPVAHDVVREAQRIHYHLFSRLLKGYKRAVLVNVFTWANRGDHLITIGERKILSRFNLTLDYYCFYPGDDCDYKGISRSKDLVVFIQGAGYIGHEAHVPVVSEAVRSFPKNRVIIFPISVCCTSNEELQAYEDIFKTHNDLWLLLRDRFSYEISKKTFLSTNCYLSPDSAFAVGPQTMTIVPTHDVIWVKRDDWENYRDKEHDELPRIPKNITALIQDWDGKFMDQKVADFMEDHQLKSMSAFVYLARGKVVITDRLHAHLMSTLLGKPNVVVNSRTRKQQNYYDTWEKSIETSSCVDSAKEAFSIARHFMKIYPP